MEGTEGRVNKIWGCLHPLGVYTRQSPSSFSPENSKLAQNHLDHSGQLVRGRFVRNEIGEAKA
jgi:hypothetical protein